MYGERSVCSMAKKIHEASWSWYMVRTKYGIFSLTLNGNQSLECALSQHAIHFFLRIYLGRGWSRWEKFNVSMRLWHWLDFKPISDSFEAKKQLSFWQWIKTSLHPPRLRPLSLFVTIKYDQNRIKTKLILEIAMDFVWPGKLVLNY